MAPICRSSAGSSPGHRKRSGGRDPAYDLGVALRDWCAELLASDDPHSLARSYCHVLAANSGVDERAIWEWGFLERVSTGLYVRAMGAEELSKPFFSTAEALL